MKSTNRSFANSTAKAEKRLKAWQLLERLKNILNINQSVRKRREEMTRKELSEVYYLSKELKMWEAKLADARSKSLIGSKEITDMPFVPGGVGDSTFEYVSKIMEIQADIDIFRINIEKKIAEIEEYIMTLDDSLLRQIIEYRCCQLKSWEQTAAMIGYGTTPDSIRMYFNRKFPRK